MDEVGVVVYVVGVVVVLVVVVAGWLKILGTEMVGVVVVVEVTLVGAVYDCTEVVGLFVIMFP